MSENSRDSSLSHSDEDELIYSVGITTRCREYEIPHDFLRNRQDKMFQEKQNNGAIYNAVLIFLGYR